MIEKGYIGRAVTIVGTNPFEYVVAGAVLSGLTLTTAGLLSGPAAGGVVAMTLKRCRGEEIDLADIFRGFENFTSTFLVGLALAGMIAFGSLFLLLPGLILAALFGFALPIAVDRPVSSGEALRQARLLGARDLFAQAVFTAVLAALACSGAVLLFVGLLVTVPLALAALTVAYYDAAYPPNTAAGVLRD